MSPSGIYATEFSENDRIVLNLIYSIKENKTYKECEKIIFEYIQSFGKVPQKINCNQKKIIHNISSYSSSRLLILYQQPLKSISQKINSYKICKTYDYINELLNT